MYQNLKKRTEGFTIIEVLIVLAIAGLIMLIVFLAVPALQRNSRNNQYRSEASALLTAATEFSNNNNGTLPASSGCLGNCGTTPAANDAQRVWQLGGSPKNLAGAFIIEDESVSAGSPGTGFTVSVLRKGAKCNTAGDDTDAGPVRSLAILYNREIQGGGNQVTCIQS